MSGLRLVFVFIYMPDVLNLFQSFLINFCFKLNLGLVSRLKEIPLTRNLFFRIMREVKKAQAILQGLQRMSQPDLPNGYAKSISTSSIEPDRYVDV